HNKIYSNKREALKRFRIFRRNLKAIRTWQENEEGTAVYGITQFSDLSPEEFKKQFEERRVVPKCCITSVVQQTLVY
ncbi:cathepsin propeptide inhibitor domain protein, partial [Cooperia oncophora]